MNPLRRGFIYLCSADSKRLAACVSAQTASFSLSLMLPQRGTFHVKGAGWDGCLLSCHLLHKGITH